MPKTPCYLNEKLASLGTQAKIEIGAWNLGGILLLRTILIDDSALTDSLDSLARRRNVSALSLYYRYYHGRCSDELKSVIPPKACFARSTRFADSQHSFAVKLEKCRTTSFANTFVSMSSRNWNSLPAFIFKPSKPGFTNTYASTLSLDQLSLLFSIFRDS